MWLELDEDIGAIEKVIDEISGAVIATGQLLDLAPALAQALGITVKDR